MRLFVNHSETTESSRVLQGPRQERLRQDDRQQDSQSHHDGACCVFRSRGPRGRPRYQGAYPSNGGNYHVHNQRCPMSPLAFFPVVMFAAL